MCIRDLDSLMYAYSFVSTCTPYLCIIAVLVRPLFCCKLYVIYSYLFPPLWYECLWLTYVMFILYLFWGLISHRVVGLNLDWICRVSSWENTTITLSDVFDARSKQLYRWSLLNNLILRISWHHFFIMALTNVGIEVGRHSWYQSQTSEQYRILWQGSCPMFS